MSRQSMAPSRNPTLLEELEKLEQSITLTLQEIDSNFSRAHRIVTTSIIPVVQEYAKHSEAVWEGSKFWKQFFEASANVSLSGYEETPPDDSLAPDDQTSTQISSTYDTNVDEDTITGSSATPPRPSSAAEDEEEGLTTELLSSPSIGHAHSTPRHPTTTLHTREAAPPTPTGASFASYGSPYESLKRELAGPSNTTVRHSIDPSTPATKRSTLPDTSMSPEASPFNAPPSTTSAARNNDPLLHQMLDKTYRIAATPHTGRKQPVFKPSKSHKHSTGLTPAPRGRQQPTTRPSALDSSPLDSSPEMAAPQLRAEIFSSPMKGGPRTPGVSVYASARKRTPAAERYNATVGAGANLFGKGAGNNNTTVMAWESDEDDDLEEELGFSPPKTMQFHVPQSRLLQTPAREASKRIVEDLLYTAGGDFTDELDSKQDDDSPSVVRRHNEMDDTF